MFVFKLSWLPWILVFGGLYFAAEGAPEAIIMSVIGGLWLYFKYKNKNSGTTSQSGTASSASKPAVSGKTVKSAPKAVTAVQSAPKTQPVEQAKPVGKFCRHCGTKVEPDDIYCVECGEKL